jgi:L-lactate dehydrogenase (cytochrome)
MEPKFCNIKTLYAEGIRHETAWRIHEQNFFGRLNAEKIAPIRDKWKGKIVLKGAATEEDTEMAIKLGLDGIIVSNHGGRQLDAAQSTIKSLEPIVKKYKGKIKIMMDSGIRTGPDIARTLASGADFAFLGRSFMYSVAALGNEGGNHIISILKTQLLQVMEQVCCEKVSDFSNHLFQSQDISRERLRKNLITLSTVQDA